jgi:hypothetical protein
MDWSASQVIFALEVHHVSKSWCNKILHVNDSHSTAISESLDWFVGENLNRKPWFLPLNMEVSCKFSLKPTAISESTEYT